MKIKFGTNTLYFCFIFLLIFMYMMEATSWKNFNDSAFHEVLQISAILLAFIYIVVRKYYIKDLMQLLLLNLIGLLCFISSGYTNLFMTMLALTLLPKGCLNKVLQMMFIEEVFLFIGIMYASQIGLLQNRIVEVNKGTYVASASSLGFGHPNMLAAQAISIVFLFLCIKRNELRGKHICGALAAVVVIFAFSHGRTSLILGVLAIVLIGLREKKWVNKVIFRILPWMYIIVFAIVIGCMVVYAKFGEYTTLVKIINDSLFNGRIGLAYRSLLVYPVTLFGKIIDTSIWNEWQYYSLDNGQVMILLEFGVAGFAAYIWIIQKALNRIKEEKEIVFAIIIIMFLIWSMYEGTMYFLGKNFALLFLGTIEFNKFTNFEKGRRLKTYDS